MARLLIVDNETNRLQDIEDIAIDLEFAKENILTAASEQAANEMIEQAFAFDLAIIDICLTHHEPLEKEGLSLIRKLRVKDPDCKIIGLTRMGGTEFGTEALKAGADDFISTQWVSINWTELLEQRLRMWRDLIENGTALHDSTY